jgi:hypothetical protein
MRASHCSKTYQLGRVRAANSACFRDFWSKITRFPGIFPGIAPTADALSLVAGFRRTLSHLMRVVSGGRSLTCCGFPGDALSLVAGFRRTLSHLLRVSGGRSLTCCAGQGSTAVGGWGARAAGFCRMCGRVPRKGCGWGLSGFGVVVFKWEGPPTRVCWGALDLNGCPAVTYSPTPSREQYHRRCGS